MFSPLSKNHQKRIRALHLKKNREAHKAFIAEGQNCFEAALGSRLHPVREIVIDREETDLFATDCIRSSISHNVPIYTCSKKEMDNISTEESPQGILVVCEHTIFPLDMLEENPYKTLLYCERISDPGNLGTIIRSAAWFGVHQILLGPSCVDPFNTKVIRASAGTIFSAELYESVDLEYLLHLARKQRYKLIATVPEGGMPIRKWNKDEKNIVLLGHETEGLSGAFIEKADHHISIPGHGNVESLNLAVAAAIILHEIEGQ